MRFVKPSWVYHGESASKSDPSPAKRQTIFSVHVHPDGSRIATGGLDAKIRIWSTKPILNSASEESGKPPKSLCTLGMHTGPVLAVRWAHSGRWLASGSDDQIVMIWDLDPHAKGRVWGSDEVNVEGWKALKRLPAHESDGVDIAWSPADRYLASVGLDSSAIVWCGFTLERLRKLEGHQGFVKGVCWDPVGEFLATQSDDNSVKIWRTQDWELEHTVTKPFEHSPGSTFFRRLSWSPDGAHITASNATNNQGFVFIAAVITRTSWQSDISLVGHENAVQVAAYNPHIFLRDSTQPPQTSNICSVVALGADDNTVSIWQTKSARPLIVAKQVFERQILDLSWSWDGLVLYAVSSDGTMAAFQFDSNELEGIAPHSVQEEYLRKFNFVPPPLPTGYSHTVPMSTPNDASQPSQPSQDFTPPVVNGTTGGVNKLVAKKRKPLNQIPSAGQGQPHINGTSAGGGGPRRAVLTSHTAQNAAGPSTQQPQYSFQQPQQPLPSTSSSFFFPSEAEQPFGNPSDRSSVWGMDVDVPIASLDGGKGKARVDVVDESKMRGRTLGGDLQRQVITPKVLDGEPVTATWASAGQANLPIPPLMNVVSAEVEGSQDTFEARNADSAEAVHQVSYLSGSKTIFLDYIPSPALKVVGTTKFCAVAMQDGCINVYSHEGRRLCQSLVTGSPISLLDGSGHALLAITSSGQVFSWNMKTSSAFFPPTSVSTVLSISPNRTIHSASVRENGTPWIICTDGTAFSYDSSLFTWVQVASKWWSEGSDVWQGRQRSSSVSQSNRPIMAYLEGNVSELSPDSLHDSASKTRPEWWSQAMTLGHLETKLHSARLLDSPQEYKQALLVYAKKIADEAFKGKAEELIKELYGPIYWRPGRDDSWKPTVAGMAKRDLLRDVLSIFAKSRTLTKLGTDWQDTLKRATNED